MYWCNGCDNPFEELVECFDGEPVSTGHEDQGAGLDASDMYEGCPHCGDWCNGCDNHFEELVECFDGEPVSTGREDQGAGLDASDVYEGCPHCGDQNYRDLVSQAENYREAQD